MPIYDFECTNCGHVYERVMKADEAFDSLSCPSCGALKPKKLIGSCSFHSQERFQERLANKMASRYQGK